MARTKQTISSNGYLKLLLQIIFGLATIETTMLLDHFFERFSTIGVEEIRGEIINKIHYIFYQMLIKPIPEVQGIKCKPRKSFTACLIGCVLSTTLNVGFNITTLLKHKAKLIRFQHLKVRLLEDKAFPQNCESYHYRCLPPLPNGFPQTQTEKTSLHGKTFLNRLPWAVLHAKRDLEDQGLLKKTPPPETSTVEITEERHPYSTTTQTKRGAEANQLPGSSTSSSSDATPCVRIKKPFLHTAMTKTKTMHEMKDLPEYRSSNLMRPVATVKQPKPSTSAAKSESSSSSDDQSSNNDTLENDLRNIDTTKSVSENSTKEKDLSDDEIECTFATEQSKSLVEHAIPFVKTEKHFCSLARNARDILKETFTMHEIMTTALSLMSLMGNLSCDKMKEHLEPLKFSKFYIKILTIGFSEHQNLLQLLVTNIRKLQQTNDMFRSMVQDDPVCSQFDIIKIIELKKNFVLHIFDSYTCSLVRKLHSYWWTIGLVAKMCSLNQNPDDDAIDQRFTTINKKMKLFPLIETVNCLQQICAEIDDQIATIKKNPKKEFVLESILDRKNDANALSMAVGQLLENKFESLKTKVDDHDKNV